MKLLSLVLIALLFATPLSGCAFFQEQLQSIETMGDDEFASIELQVYAYAKLGGKQLRAKVDEGTAAYIDTALGVLLAQSNADRAKNLAKLLNNPEYQETVVLAVSAALDFIEAQIGKPLDLSSTGLTIRQHRLVRAMLEGVREGMFPSA